MTWITYVSAWFAAAIAFVITYLSILRSRPSLADQESHGAIEACAVALIAFVSVLALYEMQP